MSSIVNKVKDALHTDKHDDTTTHQAGTTTTGTHGHSNPADPRFDAGREHRADVTSTGAVGGTGAGFASSDNYTTGTGGVNQGALGSGPGPASNTAGPHNSNMMNKADPRVDSDMDRSRNMGMNPQGTSTTSGPMSGATHGNVHGTTHATTHATNTHQAPIDSGPGPAYDTAGPHSSNMMNKTDPRVDSDMDRSRNMGMNPQGTSTTSGPMSGTTHSTTGNTHGVYNTRSSAGNNQTHGATGTTAIAGDSHNTHASHPQTGHSGLGGVSGPTTGTHDNSFNGSGPGPATNTAGPHRSDMMNKLDPRVDSNLDGSKTVGGDKTFQQSASNEGRDPTDATQVPPSVLQRHVGPPTISHDDDHHDRERRHSVSHQEQHRGL